MRPTGRSALLLFRFRGEGFRLGDGVGHREHKEWEKVKVEVGGGHTLVLHKNV